MKKVSTMISANRVFLGFSTSVVSKIAVIHIVEILIYLELILCISIINEDGCPYTFDMGNQGYNYTKPQSCFTLLPDNYTTAPQNKPHQNNGSTWGEPSSLDPFILRMMYTPKPGEFSVRVDSVDESTNIHELFIEVRRISRMGKLGKRIGFFEGRTDYEGFCCEDSKLQCTFHRLPTVGAPITTTSIKWIPLRFPSGEVVIRATVFATGDEWYANITSRRYIFPGWNILQRVRARRYTLIPNSNKTSGELRGGLLGVKSKDKSLTHTSKVNNNRH